MRSAGRGHGYCVMLGELGGATDTEAIRLGFLGTQPSVGLGLEHWN